MGMKGRLCDRRVVVGIHEPKGRTFTFLLVLSTVIAPKTKGGKGKRSKQDLPPESEKIFKKTQQTVNPSHGHGAVAVRLLQAGCSSIYVRFTERQPRDSLTGAVRLSQEPMIIIRFFLPTLPTKTLRCPRNQGVASVQCPCGNCPMLPSSCKRAYEF